MSALKIGIKAGLATLGVFLAYSACEPMFVRQHRETVHLVGLPQPFAGLKIGQISDIHCNPLISDARILDAVNKLQAMQPDLILLGGDLISARPDQVERCALLLQSLKAPLGVFAVPGNDDLKGGGFPALRKALEAQGVRWLINDSAVIERGNQRLYLAGLDDLWFGNPDLKAATRAIPPGAFTILCTHYPDQADLAQQAGIPFVIAGHSHGGQVRFPGYTPYLPKDGKRYPIGLQTVTGGTTQVFTNVGLGLAPHPFRFRCPPEVVVLTLQPATSS